MTSDVGCLHRVWAFDRPVNPFHTQVDDADDAVNLNTRRESTSTVWQREGINAFDVGVNPVRRERADTGRWRATCWSNRDVRSAAYVRGNVGVVCRLLLRPVCRKRESQKMRRPRSSRVRNSLVVHGLSFVGAPGGRQKMTGAHGVAPVIWKEEGNGRRVGECR